MKFDSANENLVSGNSLKLDFRSILSSKAAFGFLLFLPTLIALGVFIVRPILDAFRMSLFRSNILFGSGELEFVGFANYVWVFTSDWFWPTLGRTLLLTGFVVPLKTILAILVALLMDFEFPGRGLVRSLLLAPWIIPVIVISFIWSWMFNPTFGPINQLLVKTGILDQPIVWLGNTETALGAVIVVFIWKGFPFMFLGVLAGLQQIPQNLRDAATVDGATNWQEFWHITLPGISPVLGVLVILQTIFVFNNFSLVYLLTGGGPLKATETLPITTVKLGVESFRFGRASAITFVMMAVLIILFVAYYALSRSSRDSS